MSMMRLKNHRDKPDYYNDSLDTVPDFPARWLDPQVHAHISKTHWHIQTKST